MRIIQNLTISWVAKQTFMIKIHVRARLLQKKNDLVHTNTFGPLYRGP
jgi:hypothetical protein